MRFLEGVKGSARVSCSDKVVSDDQMKRLVDRSLSLVHFE